jgi:WD40 repeat protein
VRVVQAHDKAIPALAFAPNGQAVATACGEIIRVWDPGSGELRREWKAPNMKFTVLAYRPDGRQLASGSDGFLGLWDPNTTRELHQLGTPGTWVSGLTYHADGRVVSTAFRSLLVWDSQTGRLLDSNVIPDGPNLYRPVIHPDGRHVAAAMQTGPVAVWDLVDLKNPRLLSGQTKSGEAVRFRPNGHELAAANQDGSVWVWTFPQGAVRLRLTSRWPARDVAWTTDGRQLISISSRPDGQQGELTVWSAVTGRPLYKAAMDAGLERLAIQPGGPLFATTGTDGRLRLWRLPN